LSGRRQNADIADTLHISDVDMATTFRLSMGYNFACMTDSDTLFDSRDVFSGVKLSNEDIADFQLGSKGRCHVNQILVSIYMGWTLAPPGEYD